MRFVARLVSVPSSDNFKFDVAFGHCFNELFFELVDVLNIGLDNSDVCLRCLNHFNHVLADISQVGWLLLQKVTLNV